MVRTTQSDAERVWFRLIRLHTRLRTAMAGRLKAIGLSIPQYDVLSTLTEEEGLSQQALAERLYVTKGNISGLLDRLCEARLVERRAIDGDKRCFAIHLTPEGRALVRQGLMIQSEFIALTLGRMAPADLRQFDAFLVEARDQLRRASEATGEPFPSDKKTL